MKDNLGVSPKSQTTPVFLFLPCHAVLPVNLPATYCFIFTRFRCWVVPTIFFWIPSENLIKNRCGHGLLALNPMRNTFCFCFAICQTTDLFLTSLIVNLFTANYKNKRIMQSTIQSKTIMYDENTVTHCACSHHPKNLYSRASILCPVNHEVVWIFDLFSGARPSSKEWQLWNAGVSIWGVCLQDLAMRLIRKTDTSQTVVDVWFGAETQLKKNLFHKHLKNDCVLQWTVSGY